MTRAVADHDAKRNANHAELARFVTTALRVPEPLDLTVPVGPIAVRGGGKVPADVPLYVAKLRTEA